MVMVGGGVQLSKPKKVAPHIIFRDSLKSYGISVKVAIYVEYIIRKEIPHNTQSPVAFKRHPYRLLLLPSEYECSYTVRNSAAMEAADSIY